MARSRRWSGWSVSARRSSRSSARPPSIRPSIACRSPNHGDRGGRSGRRSQKQTEVHSTSRERYLVGLVVTGISQNGDIAQLEAALKAAGLPLDPIQLIGPDDSTQGAASSMGLSNPGLNIGGGQETGVTGITSSSPMSGAGTRYFRNEALSDRLGLREVRDHAAAALERVDVVLDFVVGDLGGAGPVAERIIAEVARPGTAHRGTAGDSGDAGSLTTADVEAGVR